MPNIASIAILILGLTITSCKKNKEEPAVLELKFSQEALSYVELLVNRYFIYKDSASGTFDSVVVTQSSLVNIFMPAVSAGSGFITGQNAHHRQTFTLTLTKNNGVSQQIWFHGFADNGYLGVSTSNLATPLSLYQSDPVANANQGTAFMYPFVDVFGNTATIISTLIIEGKTYSDVVCITSLNTSDTTQSYYRKSTYYWAKGVGIIKREIRTSNTVKTDLLVRNG